MKLSQVLSEEDSCPKDPEVIRAIMSDINGVLEDSDWKLTVNGVVEGVDVRLFDLLIPKHWNRIKVKFGEMPYARYKLYECKALGSLENSPTSVESMLLQDAFRVASLRGCPAKIETELNLINCGLTSLVGAPKKVGELCLKQLNKLTTLNGLEETELTYFDIEECGLRSFDGMPKKVLSKLMIDKLDSCDAIRFPRGFSMGPRGKMIIGASIGSKLSPTIVMVPGLTEIDWFSDSAGRNDIIELFNEHLQMPKTTRTYLALQTALIDNGMEWLADL